MAREILSLAINTAVGLRKILVVSCFTVRISDKGRLSTSHSDKHINDNPYLPTAQNLYDFHEYS